MNRNHITQCSWKLPSAGTHPQPDDSQCSEGIALPSCLSKQDKVFTAIVQSCSSSKCTMQTLSNVLLNDLSGSNHTKTSLSAKASLSQLRSQQHNHLLPLLNFLQHLSTHGFNVVKFQQIRKTLIFETVQWNVATAIVRFHEMFRYVFRFQQSFHGVHFNVQVFL